REDADGRPQSAERTRETAQRFERGKDGPGVDEAEDAGDGADPLVDGLQPRLQLQHLGRHTWLASKGRKGRRKTCAPRRAVCFMARAQSGGHGMSVCGRTMVWYWFAPSVGSLR